MVVKILGFGVVKEIFGSSFIGLEVPATVTAGDIKTLLEQQYPRLKQLVSFIIAVNSEIAGAGDVINTNDEIAVIPPVSGG